MKKGLKKLVIFGGIVLAGVTAYRKLKKSEEENFVKEVSKTIKDKVDEAMKETDIKDMIDRKAKKIAEELSLKKTVDRFGDKVVRTLVRKVKCSIGKKIGDYAFWSEWLD